LKDILAISTSWNYCPTACNLADLLTHGLQVQQLVDLTLWSHGPPWLSFPADWPTWNPSEALLVRGSSAEALLSPDIDHVTTLLAFTEGIHKLLDLLAYSSYTKLLHVIAYVLRFVHKTRQKLFKPNGPLTPSELSVANIKWIANIQQRNFSHLQSTKLFSSTTNKTTPFVSGPHRSDPLWW